MADEKISPDLINCHFFIESVEWRAYNTLPKGEKIIKKKRWINSNLMYKNEACQFWSKNDNM